MATQQTKKVVTKRVYESTTADEGDSPRSARGSSPARVSRLHEKEQLTSLNDRLAAYIDHIRSLESENQRLHVQVQSFEETNSREVSNVKDLYEKELQAARTLIDELSKDNAQLTVSLGTYKSESEEWMRKYSQKDRDLTSLQKKFDQVDALAEKLQADCNIRCKERDEARAEITKLKAEISDLEQQLASSKKQLEEQILSKVSLENKITTLKEELAFKASLHETELNETRRSRVDYTIDQVDTSTRQEYDHRLRQALADFRSQHDEQINLLRSELEVLYESKITGLQNELNQQDNMDGKSRTEINSYKTNISHLQSQITKLTNQNGHLEARVTELIAELAVERDINKSVLENKDAEIRSLREEIDEQLREYHDLLDLKISLDLEISAYRKLLEGEEERLNKSFDTTTGSQMKSTPRKRRRVENTGEMESDSIVQSNIQVESNYTAALQVLEVNSEQKYVKIQNSSDSEVALKGWKIIQTIDAEKIEYKFPGKTKLGPEQVFTIWSSDCDVTADSCNVLMKSGGWSADDSSATCLVNKEGEVMAVYNKSQVQRTVRTATRRTARQSTNNQTTEASGKCSIM